MTIPEFLEYVPFVRVFLRNRPAQSDLQMSTGTEIDQRAVTLGTRKKNLWLSIVVEFSFLFVFYILLSPALAMPLYNALIFHPMSEKDDMTEQIKQIEQVCHCKFEEVSFKAPDGERLNAWYFVAPKAKKTIMLSHGNAGCIQHRLVLCPLLLQSGCSLFMYDYEGYGKSSGSPTLAKLCDDAVAAFDYLTTELHIRKSDVILYGESIGCGVTSELSKSRVAGGIILQSPFTSLPDAGANALFFLRLYPAWVYPSPTLNNLAAMKSAHPPLLLIHGMKDAILPFQNSERIMAAAAEPKTLVLLPNAGHNDVCKTDVNLSIPALNEFIGALP